MCVLLSVDSAYVVHIVISLSTSRAVVRLNALLTRHHPFPWISFFKTHPKAAALAEQQAPIDADAANAKLEREAKEEERAINRICNELGLKMHEVMYTYPPLSARRDVVPAPPHPHTWCCLLSPFPYPIRPIT